MNRRPPILATCAALPLVLPLLAGAADHHEKAEKLKAVIVTGQNNHDWERSTPIFRKILEDSGRFTVDVAVSPAKGEPMDGFHVPFDKYDVVVSDYNGRSWPEKMEKAFEEYVAGGGGFVSIHAADNAFPQWHAYNEMIGVGGWGGRDEASGPFIRILDGEVLKETAKGSGGGHGPQHPYQIRAGEADHPVMKGLPPVWLHAQDELYHRLRGPAENVTVLAYAYSDPDKGGTGNNEPILMAIGYGKGRVFHNVMGHLMQGPILAPYCVGFQTTLVRGAEWAATGKVTTPVPENFPEADAVSMNPVTP